MTLVLTVYLLRLQNKSRATLYLALAFATLAVWNLAYIFASLYYHPIAAYHRWGSVFGSILISPLLARFFFLFPEDTHPRFSRIFFIAHVSVCLTVLVYFVFRTLRAGYFYHFDGHYWDNDEDQLSRIVGIYLLVSNMTFWIVGLWRSYSVRGRDRWTALSLVVTLIISGFAQGYTNVLSRDGTIERSLFQTVYSLTVVLGFFILVIIYINNTRDRTSFMTKIIGISLTTLLTVLQGLSFFTLQDNDRAYDHLRRAQLDLFLAGDRREIPPDLGFVREYDPATGVARMLFTREEPGLDFDASQAARLNTIFRERLLHAAEDATAARAVLNSAPPFAAGYVAALDGVLTAEDPERTARERIEGYLDGTHRKILTRYNKIRQLPEKNFREELAAYLKKEGTEPVFAPFARVIENFAKSRTDSDGASLRGDVLKYLAPMEWAGTRLYRAGGSAEDARHWIVFERYDQARGVVVEAGFSYRAYRAFIHESAGRLAWMVGAVLLLVLVGFQFFFQGALVSPLMNLLGGVRKVDGGDLSVRVPVRVEDEIGQLTHFFNRMVDSIREAREALQEYADGLEEKVRRRTAELQNTLEEVRSLKHQQDGDYFLTSLLLRPLSANRARSKNVSVDTLVRQKKQFSFRKWEEEIGGDCCSTYNIYLNKKRYTVFLNADAMGKSMQGAGGVLVLGAVFEAIVDRTLLSATARHVFPERWLKNTFIELHKIFEGFDGSMLVSLVMGLVDEESGLMYYINAEHPWTVLYRSEKAEFIDSEIDFRKLGTSGLEGRQIYIRTFQLEPGDVIIVGSDGRDDVLLSTNNGERVINSDETVFLRHVETGRGDLELVHREIEKLGPLTDDLSLMRISFKEDHPLEVESAHEKVGHLLEHARHALRAGKAGDAVRVLEEARLLDDRNRRIIKLQAKAYIDLKEYGKAASAAEDYTYIVPGDTEFVFLAAFCFKKIGKFDEAADFGERVRLREPNNVKNLLQLADTYFRKQNFQRAQGILEELLRLEPTNEKAVALKIKTDENLAKKADEVAL